MITASFTTKTRNMVHVQNLVKKYDGRFSGNPIDFRDGLSWVMVTFEGVSDSDRYSGFSKRLTIIDQNYF